MRARLFNRRALEEEEGGSMVCLCARFCLLLFVLCRIFGLKVASWIWFELCPKRHCWEEKRGSGFEDSHAKWDWDLGEWMQRD